LPGKGGRTPWRVSAGGEGELLPETSSFLGLGGEKRGRSASPGKGTAWSLNFGGGGIHTFLTIRGRGGGRSRSILLSWKALSLTRGVPFTQGKKARVVSPSSQKNTKRKGKDILLYKPPRATGKTFSAGEKKNAPFSERRKVHQPSGKKKNGTGPLALPPLRKGSPGEVLLSEKRRKKPHYSPEEGENVAFQ